MPCYEKNSSIINKLTGAELLNNPRFNKGTAFSEKEREENRLLGLLPDRIETIEQQMERAYQQYSSIKSNLEKHLSLYDLHHTNTALFYRLVKEHFIEMLPIIYTPTIGEAIEKFSTEFREPHGLFISYPNRNKIDAILDHWPEPNIDLMIVTDGEGILGIGDQGVGGINICIGKGMVYTLCANINPYRILPIVLDVGTNNEALLNDRHYLGWRHERISGAKYENFIQQFIDAISKKFPKAILHWEDFGKTNAQNNLHRYQKSLCSFNDDIQGTGAVALAAIISALNRLETTLSQQQIIIFGAGSAGTGIANQLSLYMQRNGLTKKEAQQRVWLFDRKGLLMKNLQTLNEAQKVFAKSEADIASWNINANISIDLKTLITSLKPTLLIGCSTAAGSFDEAIIKLMASHHPHPIIMPLSNPTGKAEATPKDIIRWTNGQALIATGSPFADVEYDGKIFQITQCNNAYAFPGIGLGAINASAKEITDNMLMAASNALANEMNPNAKLTDQLLPPLSNIQSVSKKIAIAVARQAGEDGVTK